MATRRQVINSNTGGRQLKIIGGDFKINGRGKIVKKSGKINGFILPTGFMKTAPYPASKIEEIKIVEKGIYSFKAAIRFKDGKSALISERSGWADKFMGLAFDIESAKPNEVEPQIPDQDYKPKVEVEQTTPEQITPDDIKPRSKFEALIMIIMILLLVPPVIGGVGMAFGKTAGMVISIAAFICLIAIFKPIPALKLGQRSVSTALSVSLFMAALIAYGANTTNPVPAADSSKNNSVAKAPAKISPPPKVKTPVTRPPLKAASSVDDCKVLTNNTWQYHCQRILAYSIISPIWEGEFPTKLTLTYDGDRVNIMGLIPFSVHTKYSTSIPETIAKIDNFSYVGNNTFFVKELPPTITINGTKYNKFQWEGHNHWAATKDETVKLLSAFKQGHVAKIAFNYSGDGLKFTEISLTGFSKTLSEAIGRNKTTAVISQKLVSNLDAIKLVSKHIGQNTFNVGGDDLSVITNPNGKGIFVYAPETRYSGTERLFIWFVKDGQVVKLNGATNALTPDLAFPRHVDPKLWRDTGLISQQATKTGLSLAFN